MATTTLASVNDMTMRVATVNGSGSASANGLLLKALFRMGIPVCGKNFFPSNIQGLPTWYEIRATKDAYLCASGHVDVMVAMNVQTYDKDLASVRPGGWLIYDSTWPRSRQLVRDDVTIIGVPLSQLCNDNFDGARARVLMKNIAYVGVLAALLNIDLEIIDALLRETYASKPKLIDSNLAAIRLGYDYAQAHFDCPLPVQVATMDKTEGHVLVDGNTAAGLGCVYAGATVGAWYPITPSTSLMDAFSQFCAQLRVDPETGENHYCIVQAEDELAAIGMVLGASWMGARAFTPTSGPGISLMSEFLGFAYYAEIPTVVFDVQRTGPSTGMPTRTQQSDLMACAYASHGDTRHVLLLPRDPAECFDMAVAAFDTAERFQTPVIVMSDLDIGMNDWMVPALTADQDYQPARGKVLDAQALEAVEKFHRYLDVDGDGVPYRTLPGHSAKGAYFTRGSGHNKFGGYTEDSAEYKDVVDRLLVKWDNMREHLPAPELTTPSFAKAGVIAFGSSDAAVREAVDRLAQQGYALDYLRVRAFPFHADVRSFIDKYDTVFVVEQNRDGQLRTLLINDLDVAGVQLQSVLHYDGSPITATSIEVPMREYLQRGRAA
ncbi:MAG: 2-oxoacid:acceptor oxidoreductase subunit alpha [Pseudomonadota bacterium]